MQKRNIILVLLIVVVLSAIVYLYFRNKNVKVEESQQTQEQIMNELANYKPDPNTVIEPEEIIKDLSSFKPVVNENTPSTEDIMNALSSIKAE